MKKTILFTLSFCFLVSLADAQRRRGGSFGKRKPYRFELIGGIGAMNFLGDLGGANQIGTHGFKDFEYVLTRPSTTVGMRYKLGAYFSLKNSLSWGIVKGDDNLTLEPFRNNRNLNFRSQIIELASQFEVNFVPEKKGHIYKIRGVRGQSNKDKQIYLFGGGGLIYFNPKGEWNGQWYALRPLKTEGVSYSSFNYCVMVGGGIRFSINRYWGVGFELGMRQTFTDYIDDVSTEYPDPKIFNGDPIATHFSNPMKNLDPNFPLASVNEQRGDHTHNDSYMTGMFTIGYKVMYKKRARAKF